MFAVQSIKRGEVVIVWGGSFVKGKELDKINKIGKIIIPVEEDLFSIEERNSPEDDTYFMNHSCDPNLWMKNGLTFIARKDIKKSEEITSDYAMFMPENYVSTWQCNCKSKFCRHRITGKDYLLPELQKRYNKHFSHLINKKIKKRKINGLFFE